VIGGATQGTATGLAPQPHFFDPSTGELVSDQCRQAKAPAGVIVSMGKTIYERVDETFASLVSVYQCAVLTGACLARFEKTRACGMAAAGYDTQSSGVLPGKSVSSRARVSSAHASVNFLWPWQAVAADSIPSERKLHA